MPGNDDLGFVPADDVGFVPKQQKQPGLLGRAFGAMTTPFAAMQPTLAQNKATQGGGIINKDSGDVMTGAAAAISGAPGFNPQGGSPEYDERMDRFRKEHRALSVLLPFIGAGAGPAMLPGPPAATSAGPVESGLRSVAQSATSRVLRNTGGSIALKKPLSPDVLQEVLDEGIIKPLGTSAGAAQRLETARANVGDQYGRVVKALRNAGVTGPDADAMAQQYLAEGASASANSMNPTAQNVYKSAAEQLRAKPTVAGRLDLEQAENLKRSLQDQATSAYKQMQPNEVGQAHEAAASMMRQAVEDEIAKQAPTLGPQTQAIAAQFEPVKQQAGRIIQASNVATEGMARAKARNMISPLDFVMASGEFAHSGNPLRAAAVGLGTHLLRSRGPSTVAAAANAGANALEAGAGRPVAAASLMAILEQLRRKRQEASDVP